MKMKAVSAAAGLAMLTLGVAAWQATAQKAGTLVQPGNAIDAILDARCNAAHAYCADACRDSFEDQIREAERIEDQCRFDADPDYVACLVNHAGNPTKQAECRRLVDAQVEKCMAPAKKLRREIAKQVAKCKIKCKQQLVECRKNAHIELDIPGPELPDDLPTREDVNPKPSQPPTPAPK